MPDVVEGTLKDAIALADGGGGIDVQRRSELFGQLADGDAVAVELIGFVGEARGAREHEEKL
jgi:hypothetical protein